MIWHLIRFSSVDLAAYVRFLALSVGKVYMPAAAELCWTYPPRVCSSFLHLSYIYCLKFNSTEPCPTRIL